MSQDKVAPKVVFWEYYFLLLLIILPGHVKSVSACSKVSDHHHQRVTVSESSSRSRLVYFLKTPKSIKIHRDQYRIYKWKEGHLLLGMQSMLENPMQIPMPSEYWSSNLSHYIENLCVRLIIDRLGLKYWLLIEGISSSISR